MAASPFPHPYLKHIDAPCFSVCQVILVSVCDESNAEALKGVAESCFAERLRTTCEHLLESQSARVEVR